ncbi:MAG TPA: hypothetical protein DHW82_05090 [Spirochaetia bacterium]|nr:MAG: hypothetical protein A2Y41_04615 [Spirochaetes bacterium GWB1_36_13]HCL56368.1 hypothetical protein [Spirochaetia bacterium]
MKIKKILPFILFLIGCSSLLDVYFTTGSRPEFNIEAASLSGGKIRITVNDPDRKTSGGRSPKYDHTYKEETDSSGKTTKTLEKTEITEYKYDWGYYIYRSKSPYEDHEMRGFNARSNISLSLFTSTDTFSGFKRQITGGSVEVYTPVSLGVHTLDDLCTADEIARQKTYYYRAAKAKKTWNCSSDCTCSTTSETCSSYCECSGSWETPELTEYSAWVSATCLP